MAAPSSPRRRILLLTHSEHGQANAAFSIIHELLIRGDVDVHIASFSDLEPRIAQVNARAKRAAPDRATQVHVHWLPGQSMYQLWLNRPEVAGSHEKAIADMLHERGFLQVWRAYGKLPDIIMSSSPEQYVAIMDDVKRLQNEIQPDQVVIDTLLVQAIEGAILAGCNWMLLSSNTLKDLAAPYQKNGAALWKLPTFGTGWEYPLKLWLIPLNIILQIRLLWIMLFSSRASAVNKARKKAGVTGLPAILQKYSEPFLIPVQPEMDYPVFVPDNMHSCGPFLLPSEPVEDVDTELAEWIRRGPLVLINRGSHMTFSDNQARRMAYALRKLRRERPDLRVLWKLRREKDTTDDSVHELQKDIDSDMVRIVSWLKPDPLAILRTGNVICMVHHGGANSSLECISTGVPSLVLPGWFDCWDWAARIEFIGVGIWGNRGAGLALNRDELAKGFLRVCAEPSPEELESLTAAFSELKSKRRPRGGNLRVNAQLLAQIAGAPGSKTAADMILQRADVIRENRLSGSADTKTPSMSVSLLDANPCA